MYNQIEQALGNSNGQILSLEVVDWLGYFVSFDYLSFGVTSQIQYFLFQTSHLYFFNIHSLGLLQNLQEIKIDFFMHYNNQYQDCASEILLYFQSLINSVNMTSLQSIDLNFHPKRQQS